MKKIINTALLSTLFLTGCLDSGSDDDKKKAEESFIIFSSVENEFIVTTNPLHNAEDVSVLTSLMVEFTGDFPDGNYSELDMEVFGFSADENCLIEGDGFKCDGKTPWIFDGDLDKNGFELEANVWHSDLDNSIARNEADYEILFTGKPELDLENNTATFTTDVSLSAGMTYAVHLFGGSVQYSDQEGNDNSDFHSYWIFSTSSVAVE